MNIRRLIVIVVFILAKWSSYGQQTNQDSDSIILKKILYHSMVCDNKHSIPWYYMVAFDTYYSSFENFSFFMSKKLQLHTKPYTNRESTVDVYSVQLFKFYMDSSQPYYILKIDGCVSLHFELLDDVWIRIAGFSESDLKLLFDFWTKNSKLTIKDIQYMINSWQEGDELFTELDWDCLLEGYLKNNPKQDCYLSWSKALAIACVWGLDARYYRDQMYASFSTKNPLFGFLR